MLTPNSTWARTASPGTRYRIDGAIGCGPHGSVVVGQPDRLGGTRVALRRARVPRGRSRDALRFRAETLACLGHPALAVVHDIIDDGDEHVIIASTLGEDGNLADVIAAGGCGVERAADMVGTIADALAAAHRAGLHHGHLVAEDIVFGPHGPMVADLALPPAHGVPASDDRRALAALGRSLIDPVGDDRAAAHLVNAFTWLATDPAATLARFSTRIAEARTSLPPAEAVTARASRVVTSSAHPAHDRPRRAAVGLVVAGAAVTGLAIGGVIGTLPW